MEVWLPVKQVLLIQHGRSPGLPGDSFGRGENKGTRGPCRLAFTWGGRHNFLGRKVPERNRRPEVGENLGSSHSQDSQRISQDAEWNVWIDEWFHMVNGGENRTTPLSRFYREGGRVVNRGASADCRKHDTSEPLMHVKGGTVAQDLVWGVSLWFDSAKKFPPRGGGRLLPPS